MRLEKKRVFSGVQPTGKLHLGNYAGAISLWVKNQDLYNNIFCIVDLHAITIPENVRPEVLRQKNREIAALYLACGIDPQKSTVFIQSHVREHAELTWILNCVTPVGWLERMTQYKSKSKQTESVGTGLLDYPVLQAADILLYDTELVPVGQDQVQHIELTRDIALRFNHLFGETFVIPEAQVPKSGARIMGLDNPENKMSKSLAEISEGHAIGLLDTPESIKKVIMRAVTDSSSEMRYAFASPGVLNLLTIFEIMTGKEKSEVEAYFEGKGYGFLKREVLDAVLSKLTPIRENYDRLIKDTAYLEEILKQGAQNAESIAAKTYYRVKEAIGIG